jgi:hypothetical protein
MKPIYFALMFALSAASCDRGGPVVRTDPAPIVARVQLPARSQDVVWTAEPVVKDGCIPAHDSPTRIHAFIAGYQGEGAPGSIDVPLVIANKILPAPLRARGVIHGDALRIQGTVPNKGALERPEKAQIRQAVMTGEGLMLELWVRD